MGKSVRCVSTIALFFLAASCGNCSDTRRQPDWSMSPDAGSLADTGDGDLGADDAATDARPADTRDTFESSDGLADTTDAGEACGSPTRTEDQTHYFNDGRVAVTVPLDRLALLASHQTTRSRVQQLAGDFDLSIASRNRSLYMLKATCPKTRLQLAELARRVRDTNRGFIEAVGFLSVEPPTRIVTDRFIARFAPGVTRERIDRFNARNGVRVVEPFPMTKNEFLLRVTDASDADALAMANRYHRNALTEYAHPNFIGPLSTNSTPP